MKEVGKINYSIATEYKDGYYRVIFNFKNNAVINVPSPPIKEDQSASSFKSTIDLDVIRDNMTKMSLASILKVIEEIHGKQKEVFFSILREDFLETLNPVY